MRVCLRMGVGLLLGVDVERLRVLCMCDLGVLGLGDAFRFGYNILVLGLGFINTETAEGINLMQVCHNPHL